MLSKTRNSYELLFRTSRTIATAGNIERGSPSQNEEKKREMSKEIAIHKRSEFIKLSNSGESKKKNTIHFSCIFSLL